jgi:hypothetical protein
MINDNIKSVVREVIHSWNPYGLLPHAPYDEFESEIEEVSQSICDAKSIDDFGYSIQMIFERSFGEPFIYESCLRVAGEIWSKTKR